MKFMLKEPSSRTALKNYFKKNKLGKLQDLMNLLNTKSRMTVFRKLRDLNYLSSYTHAGSYYTLNNIPDFNSSDLWYFKEVGFSKLGNLKKTVVHLIEQSGSGITHEELEKKLHLRVYNTLLDLVKSKKITRTKIDGEYVYFSVQVSQSKKQTAQRKNNFTELKNIKSADWFIIEILASVIRVTETEKIEPLKIVSDLARKEILLTEEQVEQVLNNFDLKKTLEQS